MDFVDFEKQFTPSQWSKRFNSSAELLDHHIQFVTSESDRSRRLFKYFTVAYGLNTDEKIDVYYEEEKEGSPILVYIHGGFWQELSKDDSAYIVTPYARMGSRVAILGYDLCPKVTLPEIVEQIRKGLQYILDYARNTSAKSVLLIGHSAGAHLIASLLNDENILRHPLLKAIFLISGVYDLTELWKTTAANPGNILSLNEETAKVVSPMLSTLQHLRNSTINIYLYVAENDSEEFIKQSQQFTGCITKCGAPVQLQIIPNHDHFDIVEHLSDPNFEISKVILEKLISTAM